MGQYHLVVNLDKREFISPHKLGAGLKLMEQAFTSPGSAGALLILLACSNGRGGGDFGEDNVSEDERIAGRWAGDRIAVVGDYADDGCLAPEHRAGSIYAACRDADETANPDETDDEYEDECIAPFTDITPRVCSAIEASGEGMFVGDGWRQLVYTGLEVARWRPEGERQTGKVVMVDLESRRYAIQWGESKILDERDATAGV